MGKGPHSGRKALPGLQGLMEGPVARKMGAAWAELCAPGTERSGAVLMKPSEGFCILS